MLLDLLSHAQKENQKVLRDSNNPKRTKGGDKRVYLEPEQVAFYGACVRMT